MISKKPSKGLSSKESKIQKIPSIFADTTNTTDVVKKNNLISSEVTKENPPRSPPPKPQPESHCDADSDTLPRTPSSTKTLKETTSNDNHSDPVSPPPPRKSFASDCGKSHYSGYSSCADSFYSANLVVSPVKMALSPKVLSSPRSSSKSKYSFEYVSNCTSQQELEQIVETLERKKDKGHSSYRDAWPTLSSISLNLLHLVSYEISIPKIWLSDY
mmetsp:Transcript_5577/g.8555  ORF Transcript_5577/g.8555 Transcript_5577/m.8555 type:complete len:216 (+) Transcript_5577:344-991(+)|eukprot:CAMPEP_0178934398 /NCGR_PEP_ID=MMETSP0786-20121207/23839_1 /TAXON_ID=186022 /ORGANISM="Thalassionema frauenfeldii, Strain CCMP 1798" /LENGTH=215 /DNA_ID=CAMNT_0020612173 /DNA_START=762 /DNA_END=1409 /DNA_ORIENTATION=-